MAAAVAAADAACDDVVEEVETVVGADEYILVT